MRTVKRYDAFIIKKVLYPNDNYHESYVGT